MVQPTPLARKEVSLNTTRIGHLDAMRTDKLSQALPDLLEQVWTCAEFMKRNVPGFENAVFSGIAPRIGIRETRRITGDIVLNGDDVMQARKRPDGIGKGAHELDIHLAGTGHVRSTIKDGGSYDIPFGCLTAKGLANVMVAGRFSPRREAHSSARVMGTCMAMGQATGTASAMLLRSDDARPSFRALDVQALRTQLKKDGAVLDGTR